MTSGASGKIDVQAFLRKADEAMLIEAQKLADFASKNSPVGATERFKRTWQAFLVRDGVVVLNALDYAKQALVGISQEQGRQNGADESLQGLARWVEVVLDVDDQDRALLIARSILLIHQTSGSERYRSGKNILDLDRDTLEPKPNSPVLRTGEAIAARINAIEL